MIARYLTEVQKFFANKVSSPTEVSDLVSQTFLACTSSLPGVDGSRGFRPFLFGVASNVYCGYLRRISKRALEVRDFETVCVNQIFERTMSSIVMGKRRCQAFVDGLCGLPVNDQILLEYRYFLDFSAEEIAVILGRPAATIRGRLMRARGRLRERVEQLMNQASATAPTADATDLERWSADVREQFRRRFGEPALQGARPSSAELS